MSSRAKRKAAKRITRKRGKVVARQVDGGRDLTGDALPQAGKGHSLLRLQRRVGNHGVRRMIIQAQKEDGGIEITPAAERAIRRSRGGGQALDRSVREQMEPSLGADFGRVRVHTNDEADALNRDLKARAFTTGQDIFFRRGEYNPGSSDGRELLAHELAHVKQQKGSPVQTKLRINPPGDKYEQEADQAARSVMQQERAAAQPQTPGAQVSRQKQEDEESLQAQPVQRQAEEEEELQAGAVQRQPEEDEEAQAGGVQRQAEEDEELQAGAVQRQPEEDEESEAGGVQRQADEDEELQASMIQRQAENNPAVQGLPKMAENEEVELVRQWVAKGSANENMLTNKLFYRRHPEADRSARIRPGTPEVSEWIQIRNDVVRPVLRSPAGPAKQPPTMLEALILRPLRKSLKEMVALWGEAGDGQSDVLKVKEQPAAKRQAKNELTKTLKAAMALEEELRNKYPNYAEEGGFAGYGSGKDRYVCTTFAEEVLSRAGYKVSGKVGSEINIVIDYKAESGVEKPTPEQKQDALRKLVEQDDPRTWGVVNALVKSGQGVRVMPEELQPGDFIQYWTVSKKGTSGHVVQVVEVLSPGKMVKVHGSHKSKHGVTTITVNLKKYTKVYGVRPLQQ